MGSCATRRPTIVPPSGPVWTGNRRRAAAVVSLTGAVTYYLYTKVPADVPHGPSRDRRPSLRLPGTSPRWES